MPCSSQEKNGSRRVIAGKFRIHSSQKRLQTDIFVFGLNVPINYMSVTQTYFSGIHIQRITLHVFVFDSENYMENCLGIIFVEIRISVTQKNVFGISFAIIYDWSVVDLHAMGLVKNKPQTKRRKIGFWL